MSAHTTPGRYPAIVNIRQAQNKGCKEPSRQKHKYIRFEENSISWKKGRPSSCTGYKSHVRADTHKLFLVLVRSNLRNNVLAVTLVILKIQSSPNRQAHDWVTLYEKTIEIMNSDSATKIRTLPNRKEKDRNAPRYEWITELLTPNSEVLRYTAKGGNKTAMVISRTAGMIIAEFIVRSDPGSLISSLQLAPPKAPIKGSNAAPPKLQSKFPMAAACSKSQQLRLTRRLSVCDASYIASPIRGLDGASPRRARRV